MSKAHNAQIQRQREFDICVRQSRNRTPTAEWPGHHVPANHSYVHDYMLVSHLSQQEVLRERWCHNYKPTRQPELESLHWMFLRTPEDISRRFRGDKSSVFCKTSSRHFQLCLLRQNQIFFTALGTFPAICVNKNRCFKEGLGISIHFFLFFLFWSFYGFIDRTVSEMTGNRMGGG